MYCKWVPEVDTRIFKKKEKQPIILLAAWHSLKATWSKKERKKNLYQRRGAILLLRRIRLRPHEQALSKRWHTSMLRKKVGTCINIGRIKRW